MLTNQNLCNASRDKYDEFYTKLIEIQEELQHYEQHFQDKVVYCNCDNPKYSNFWKYFSVNFQELKLKKLISTYYDEEFTYKRTIYFDEMGRRHTEKIPLTGNGDFRSPECAEILEESDIVVTNPPFSLFREYVVQLIEHGKEFLILGSMNAITYKEIFPLFKYNKIWLGVNNGQHEFDIPDDYDKGVILLDENGKRFARLRNIAWFTNLDIEKRHEKLMMDAGYNETDYPVYDNYEAINVDKMKDVPCDYNGVMGVPITFLDKYNPEQFNIVGLTSSSEQNAGRYFKGKTPENNTTKASVNGKCIYARVLIKKKK